MRLRAALALLAVALLSVSLRGTAVAQTAVPAVDANTAATAAIQDCVRLGSTGEPTWLACPELELRRCSDLPAALQAAGIEPLIIDSSRAVIDRDSLRQLPTLIHRAAGPAPPVAALGPILRELRGDACARSRGGSGSWSGWASTLHPTSNRTTSAPIAWLTCVY